MFVSSVDAPCLCFLYNTWGAYPHPQALSGMLQKFHSFHPISLIFLTYVLLSYFVYLHCTNIHILLHSFSFDYDITDLKQSTWPDKAVYWRYSKCSKRYWSNKLYSTTLSGPKSPSLSQYSEPGGLSAQSSRPAS